jgi:hypothetical protein
VIAGVFLFVPGTLQPFSEGGQEDIVTVNRVADGLSLNDLSDSKQPHVLNESCVEGFFNDTIDACGYTSGDPGEYVGIKEPQGINVTLQGNISGSTSNTILYYNGSKPPGDRLAASDSTDATRLAIGERSPEIGSSVTARRVVSVDDKDIFLVVKVW